MKKIRKKYEGILRCTWTVGLGKIPGPSRGPLAICRGEGHLKFLRVPAPEPIHKERTRDFSVPLAIYGGRDLKIFLSLLIGSYIGEKYEGNTEKYEGNNKEICGN